MPKWEAKSEVSGFVWKVETAPGQKVAKGDTLVVIESMKMEIPVVAEVDGVVVSISVEEGAAVDEGKTVAVLEVWGAGVTLTVLDEDGAGWRLSH